MHLAEGDQQIFTNFDEYIHRREGPQPTSGIHYSTAFTVTDRIF